MTPTQTSACGLDFGTSNSTLGVAGSDGPQLLPLEASHLTIPSAIFFGAEREEAFLIGRQANAAYVDGAQGRLMRSLKSILGSSLIDEKTQIPRHRISFKEVITRYVAELKARAERRLGHEITEVVQGRLGHRVLLDVEHAKIVLSSEEGAASHLGWLEEGLSITSTRQRFEQSTTRHFEKLRAVANACVAAAGLRPEQIDALFFTGGTSLVPSVQRAIAMDFSKADVIHGDQFGSVGLGLAIEARRRYR